MKIFVAGASGVIGRILLPKLVEAGHEVTGMTRRKEQGQAIEELGAKAVIADVFNLKQMVNIISENQPDVVIHQLTALSQGSSAENARIRMEGTRNLVNAARQANVKKIIAQSISWAYEPGDEPAMEEVALDVNSPLPRSTTISGIAALESAVTEIPDYVILRYGTLYGPSTWYDKNGATAGQVRNHELTATDGVSSFIHVEDAANAAFLALAWPTGTYNIVDDEPAKGIDWLPVYADILNAPSPELQLGAGGWERGALNTKVKNVCGWNLHYPTWRTGFLEALR